jgi:ABC-2 type transport system permease protein
MRTIFFLLRKEFRQIFRHRVMLPMIFIMPIVQLLVLSNAADFEVRNVYLHVLDRDQSTLSRQLVGKFAASRHFQIVRHSFSPQAGREDLASNTADIVLDIPPHFEKDLRRGRSATLHLSANAINATKAGLGQAYAQAIIRDFNQQVRAAWIGLPAQPVQGRIDVPAQFWYNPALSYKAFMVPGILVMLVTLVGMFLSGINIVKEKEIGTIEQINVTPIHKVQFIIGKLLPFWIIANVELALGLAFGRWVFHIPVEGSLWVVFGFAAVYLLAVLGLGLFISTITETQQQAMLVSYFFLVVFILMSGLFTQIENMPSWAQKITWFNPVAYFIEVMRMVLLKGSGWYEIRGHLLAVAGLAVGINLLAILNYRKIG